MDIHVFYDKENKDMVITLESDMMVKDLLSKLSINPITVLVSRDGGLLLEDEPLNDKDNIKLYSVISGG